MDQNLKMDKLQQILVEYMRTNTQNRHLLSVLNLVDGNIIKTWLKGSCLHLSTIPVYFWLTTSDDCEYLQHMTLKFDHVYTLVDLRLRF